MVEAGGGIYLTQNFDFEVNEAGDIRTTRGVSELEKDLAFKSADNLQEILGEHLTPKTRGKIKQVIKRVASDDPRVGQPTSITVTYPEERSDRAKLTIVMETLDGEQPLVFEVGKG